ncbi:Alpha-L-fucosidase [Posidoniimonas corsicana]|uniref:alpha-L-fucosidase n=1 Tax=Posidoniimonas corsicana TaxID=1938618 RepID=A0A5C5VJA3_9BACT|nr:alpha-L-fucosidase [Posidoniimonas corsicana]TWT37969.1 Alpha-L-fucosidase [Posidoniimonas corsicana]
MKRPAALCCLLLLTACAPLCAQPIPPETPAQRDARMEWWRDARFGMFIHWGVYAIPGGEWEGKQYGGIAEWIMNSADIPVDDYERLASRFNPAKYAPAAWAKAAKQAGMKYVVITSKHHDGFCLFDTETTEWDVVDATPYGRDLLKPLAAACRAEGLKFCTYYSIMDWHHPAQGKSDGGRYNPSTIKPDRKQEYIKYMEQQLAELLDSCDPEVLWFDGEWPDWWTEPDGRRLYAYLRELKPTLIINNRVGKGRKGMEGLNKGDQEYVGDFGTPEQQIPATGLPGVDWESCMTMNDSWGFRRDDDNWKPTETLIRNLVDIASKGGNYLLNVGPTADGEIPKASLERLQEIGHWMAKNGESIYGTTSSPFPVEWGRCTQRQEDGKTVLYLHVFDWPADGQLTSPVVALGKGPVTASLLATGDPVQVQASDEGLLLRLPAKAPDKVDSVIKVTLP